MRAGDGKLRFTDVASPETLLRLIQSVPNPKADRRKLPAAWWYEGRK